MKKNIFGHDICDPLLVFDNNFSVLNLVSKNMEDLFSYLQIQDSFPFSQVIDICTKELKQVKKIEHCHNNRLQVEQVLRNEILKRNVSNKLDRAFHERAEKISDQLLRDIQIHFPGRTELNIADIGCGDGLVSWHLKRKLGLQAGRFLIADVLDYRDNQVRQDKFHWNLLDEKGYHYIDSDENHLYDVVILCTVLHHSEDPQSVINACYKSLRKNGLLILIESCIGVDEQSAHAIKSVSGVNIYNSSDTVKDYLHIGSHGQTLYGIVVDWFYNRVLHTDVSIPFNFHSPHNWNKLVQEYAGMNLQSMFYEGFDQIAVPEFHTLHFFKKQS